ncbi:MAG: alpha/beta hydrolase [Pseudomonadota bacterium]
MDQTLPQGLAGVAPEWFEWAIAQAPHSHFVEANGNRLHYLEWNAQDSHKPVLLFVHGLRAHAHWWDFIAPFFIHSHRVVALDLSGMGESGWRPGYSAPLLAQDLICFIEALDLAAPTVVAHSYGGLCTLRAASMRPELFGRVVVLDTFVIFPGEKLFLDPPRVGGGKAYEDRAAARQRYRLLPPQPEPAAALLDHIAHHSMREGGDGVRWKFDPALNGVDIHLYDGDEMLAKISAPVDYCYGERSALVQAQHARRIVDALPNRRGPIAIAEAHHHLMLDQPLALVSTLNALLAEQ